MRLHNPTTEATCTSWRIFSLALLLHWHGLAADSPLAVSSGHSSSDPNTLEQSPPIHLQEPYILAHAKRYFLFGTASVSEGFQCYESVDLVRWKLEGWAWRRSGLHVARGELHSPQVFQYQGMFCLLYSARMPTGLQLGLAA